MLIHTWFEDNMASSILLVSVLLVVACVADGQSTTSQNSHCSYTFRVPEGDCGKTPADDQLLKNSVVALQAQMKLLADDNVKLRQEIATIKTGNRSY
ncbi:hypothetical protein LSAT2_018618 [Lamellibrachia satsuma]|nr:hypothetical protein LSAT2_018618 [Lamellibrachia satsuma]